MGSFANQAPDRMAQAGRLIDLNRHLRTRLEDMAHDHVLSTYAKPAAQKDIHVDPPVAAYPHRAGAEQAGEAGFLSPQQIADQQTPVLLLGGRDASKTSFAYSIAIQVCDGLGTRLRSPIYLDLAPIRPRSDVIIRHVQNALKTISERSRATHYCERGDFIFIFDHFDANDTRKANMVTAFMRSYPNNGYLLLACYPAGLPFRVASKHNLDAPHKKLYIHPIKRPPIGVSLKIRLSRLLNREYLSKNEM